jgi:eukaryotic-like serine/threonine-protein kinase
VTVGSPDTKTPLSVLPQKTGLVSVGTGFPDDLADESFRRLGTVAGVFGVMMGLNLLSNVVVARLGGPLHLPLPGSSVASRGLFVVLAFVTLYASRRTLPSRATQHLLGMSFEVAGALVIALLEITYMPEAGLEVGPISSVGLWILVFQMLIPLPTVKASVAAGLSVLMVPLALWAGQLAGQPEIPPLVYAGQMKTVVGAAVIAVFASRAIYRLGTEVTRARQMGSYQLDELLGEGGMGQVWRASHRLLQRPAAVKIIRPEMHGATPVAEGRLLARFEQEAQATANLESVHTVRLFDFGQTRRGTFYIVMELLDGLDLEALVERFGPLPASRVAFILRQVCHSLGEAHRRGMVHRDIKPTNVFLCRLGPDHDFVKVLDFGLVRETGQPDQNVTAEGMAAGTPAFMAPEMVLGTHEVGPAADIYMLGCLAWWLLTGRLVFEGPTALAVVTRHAAETPDAPSVHAELDVPQKLDELVLQCLSKDPRERPASAEEVAERLEGLDLGAVWTSESARRWWETHHPSGSE